MTVILFGRRIRRKKHLVKVLEKNPKNDHEKNVYAYLHGILASSIFGLVIYKIEYFYTIKWKE